MSFPPDGWARRTTTTPKRVRTLTPERAALISSGQCSTGVERRETHRAAAALLDADSELLRELRDPPGRYSSATFFHSDRGNYDHLQRPDHDPNQTSVAALRPEFDPRPINPPYARRTRRKRIIDPETGLERRLAIQPTEEAYEDLGSAREVDQGGYDR